MYCNALLDIMVRRRKIDSEDVGERITTSLRLPVELLERIDNAWKGSDKYTGRTHFIEKACEHYLNCEPCPNCNNLNHKQAVVCSFCETKLESFYKDVDSIKSLLFAVHEMIGTISDAVVSYDDLNEKIHWLVEKLPPAIKSDIERTIQSPRPPITNGLRDVRYFLMLRDLYSTYDKLPLPNPSNPVNEHYMLDLQSHVLEFTSKYGELMPSVTPFAPVESQYLVYSCRVCEIILENPDKYTTEEIRKATHRLENMLPYVYALSNSIVAALSILENFEKMIMIQIKNQNP